MVDIPDDSLEPPEEPSGELEALREMNRLLCQELAAKNEQIREYISYFRAYKPLYPPRRVPSVPGGGFGSEVNYTVCLGRINGPFGDA
jgi:hypothetical protein